MWLGYKAPTLIFARGPGEPGQQRSTGFNLVMALNIIAVLALVVGCVRRREGVRRVGHAASDARRSRSGSVRAEW